jgi:hypothetical protein
MWEGYDRLEPAYRQALNLSWYRAGRRFDRLTKLTI